MAAVSVQIGMLGVTVRGTKVDPDVAIGSAVCSVGVGSSVLVHDAGALGPPGRAGHAPCPLGTDATPGVGSAALSPALQLALGPEAGHCLPPTGSERRIGSSAGTTCVTGAPVPCLEGAARAGAACPNWLETRATATIA